MAAPPSLASAIAQWMQRNREWVATAASAASLATWVLPEKWTGEDMLSEGLSSLLGVISLVTEPAAGQTPSPKEPPSDDLSKAQARQLLDQKRTRSLEFCVSILKEIEVFAEVVATKFFPRNNFQAVGLIELAKLACRLGLLYHGNGRTLIQGCAPSSPHSPARLLLQPFILPASKSKKPLTEEEKQAAENTKKILQGWRPLFLSEMMYHSRPVLYVLALAVLGGKRSWRPWLFSVMLEVITLALAMQGEQVLQRMRCPILTKEDKLELRRRKMSCLLYLMRQPALDRLTYPAASKVIKLFAKVPLLGIVANFGESVLLDMGSRYFYTSCS